MAGTKGPRDREGRKGVNQPKIGIAQNKEIEQRGSAWISTWVSGQSADLCLDFPFQIRPRQESSSLSLLTHLPAAVPEGKCLSASGIPSDGRGINTSAAIHIVSVSAPFAKFLK